MISDDDDNDDGDDDLFAHFPKSSPWREDRSLVFRRRNSHL